MRNGFGTSDRIQPNGKHWSFGDNSVLQLPLAERKLDAHRFMIESPEYTIAVCNYNMEDTVGQAIDSMLDLTDDRFEVLVVDDASTDESVEVLKELEGERDRLRIVELAEDPNRQLGQTRNIAVQKANGEHVLLQMDADDVYERGIVDFTEIYSQLRLELDRDFYLKGRNINIAQRDFLLTRGPYRNLVVGAEDQDFWRRLFAADEIIWLDHEDISKEIGYTKSMEDHLRRSFRVRVGEFQSGISFPSYLTWSLRKWRSGEQTTKGLIFDLLTLPTCYLIAQTRKSYTLPENFRSKEALPAAIEEKRATLEGIEEQLGITVDRDQLSKSGNEVY